MKREEIACVVCQARDYDSLYAVRDLRLKTTASPLSLVRCRRCSLVYVNPRPIDDELAASYPQGYHRPYPQILDKIYSPISGRPLDRIVHELHRYKKHGRVLDVGCGTGALLQRFQREGYEVYGVDPSLEITEMLPRGLRGRVRNKTVAECHFDDSSFDIITVKQVLEHLLDPNAELQELHRVLKNDGVLYIEVPNFECPEARLFAHHWYNLEVPRHLYQFSLGTLRRLVENNGLRLDAVLTNSGIMLFKSPLAVYNSLSYTLADWQVAKSSTTRRVMNGLTFLPALALTLALRASTWNGVGMDIRTIFRKAA